MMKITYQEQDCSGTRAEPEPTPLVPAQDPTVPDLGYLRENFAEALGSFYATIERIMADNPVDLVRLTALAGKAQAGALTPEEQGEFQGLRAAAARQGRAVGGVYGFFLKFKPYEMLAEVRGKAKLFQPPVGPVLVVEGDSLRDVLSRHDEFTVDPYGREMIKSMTAAENGGFDSFILSTDDPDRYLEDKALLTAVVNRGDAERIRGLIHEDCLRRVSQAVSEAQAEGLIDVVTAVARFLPVTLSHLYLGVPAAEQRGSFELTDAMLTYYGQKAPGPDGQTPLPINYQRPDGSIVDLPDSALARGDGVIPDELQIYLWIKACFRNFFNNVQKDVEVQARGVRAYRELLAYLLREVDLQRAALTAGQEVPDSMLTRLLKLQMGIASPTTADLENLDPARVGDLRIAENVMGTVVGAIAGQEEATCRVIDSMLQLQEGVHDQGDDASLPAGQRYGSFEEARQLALNVLEERDAVESRRTLLQYVLEALRLRPQGEVLLRECVRDGATIADSRPLRAGTLIFASHGSAMQDMAQPGAFIIGRDDSAYLQHGYGRHKCLGQYVSPVIMVESLIAILGLEGLHRPEARPGESAFPLERRFGRLQLDDSNLYAESFTLGFDPGGTTAKYYR